MGGGLRGVWGGLEGVEGDAPLLALEEAENEFGDDLLRVLPPKKKNQLCVCIYAYG